MGDFIVSDSGNELIVTEYDSTQAKTYLIMLTRTGEYNWESKQVLELSGEVTGLAWGTLLNDENEELLVSIGNELVLVEPDQGGSTWTKTILNSFDKSITNIDAGDLLAVYPGEEIISTDEENNIYFTYMDAGNNWNTTAVDMMVDSIMDVTISDFDPSAPGNQLFAVDDKGNLIQKENTMINGNDMWSTDTLWTETSGSTLNDITLGDADNDGNIEILTATAGNKLIILDQTGDGSWKAKEIFNDQATIRNIAVVDIDPFHDGFEVICAGESKTLTELTHNAGAWSARGLYIDTYDISSLFAGMVDDTNLAVQEVITVNGEGGQVRQTEFSGYYSETLYSGDNKLSGVGFGDLDPDKAGVETFAVGMDIDNKGIVAMAWRDGESWANEVLFNGVGELLTPVVGDFDGNDGNEFAVVGMLAGAEGPGKGQVTMIKKVGSKFNSEQIMESPRFLHGAAVGDFLAENVGDELIVTSFTDKGTANVSAVYPRPESLGGGWNFTLIWQSNGHVRKAAFADIDPTIEGDELYVVDKSGNLTMLYEDATGFHSKWLWQDPGTPGLARIGIGDADNDGELEILVGGDSMNVGLIERRSNGDWEGAVIYTDINKIRGTVIGDFDDDHDGNEIAVYGYSARVTMLTADESNPGEWNSKVLFTDVGRGHDLAVGDFDPVHSGNELLLSGFSKNLTMLAYYSDLSAPSFSLKADNPPTSIEQGGTAVIDLKIESTGNYNDRIFLDVLSLSAGAEIVSFESQELFGSGNARLTLAASPDFSGTTIAFKIEARSAGARSEVSISLDVQEKEQAEFEIEKVHPEPSSHDISVEELEIEIEFNNGIDINSVEGSVKIISEDGDEFKGTYELSADNKTLIIKDIHQIENTDEELPENAKINITILTTLQDSQGNYLGAGYSWEFETGSHEGNAGVMEGLGFAVVILIVVIILIAIIGIIVGRKKVKESDESKKD